jgi:hypothetical protein
MTPIETAVAPLKNKAIDSAAARAREIVGNVASDMIAHGGDINAAAPYPRHSYTFEGQRAKSKYNLYHSLTKQDPNHRPSYRMGEPSFKIMDGERVEKFVEEMKAMAAAQYEAFVAKLVMKVGDHTGAELSTPTGVWDYSYVLVTKADGTTENWKTQCISKYSKLGKFFHQWPTRMLKPGSKR